MPTDTQRAPTLSQCIEREREAVDNLTACPSGDIRQSIRLHMLMKDARAATDEAVRAVEAVLITPEEAQGIAAAFAWGVPYPMPELLRGVLRKLEMITTPAPTAQGESTTPSDAPKCDVCGVPVEPTTSGFWEGRKMTWHCAAHALPTFPAQGGEVDSAYYDGVLARLMDARQRALGSPTVAVPWDDSAGIVALLLRTAQGESTGGDHGE